MTAKDYFRKILYANLNVKNKKQFSQELDILFDHITDEGDMNEEAVKKLINDAIANVVDSAPENFDTLKELADWIANDTDGAAAMATQIQNNEKSITELQKIIETQEVDTIENADIDKLFA